MDVKKDSTGIASDSTRVDSINKPKEVLEGLVKHKADDYIRNDFVNRLTTLYNNAELHYQDIDLSAGIITIDYQNKVAFAKGIIDSTGTYTQRPHFKQANQESDQDSLAFNFDTHKAVIYNTRTEQEGVIIYGQLTKRENDSVFYINKAHFTTSTKEKPDYEIVTNNIKVVPGKKIVGGLSELYLANVPTPAILPFFYVPITKGRASGFIMPSWNESPTRGFSLQNGGYYFAINDYVDLAVTGDVYTNGSWGMRFQSNYSLRYKFSGNFNLNFENIINGLRGFPDYSRQKNFNIRWSHSQSAQSNPNSRFSASVNMGSQKYFQQSLNEYNISDRVTNTFQSSINYYKKLVGTPFNMNVSLTHSQNTNTGTINMTLPSFQLGMDRIYPFAPKSGIKKNALQNIGLNYSFDAQNSLTTTDQEFLKKGMFKNARSGAKHTASLSTNVKAFKYITLSPSVNYREIWYLKTIEKHYDTQAGEIVNDTINGFASFRDYSGGVSASTTLYGTFNFKRGRLQAIRHQMTPSISFNYRPDFSFYYDEVQQSDDPNDLRQYSRFDGGIYGAPSRGLSSSVSFSLANTIEAKVMPKDSTETEAKKISILKNLNFSTSYNIAADSLKWSPVSVSAGTALFDNKLNLNAAATLNPYALNASNRIINKLNINNGGSLFRLTSASLSASYSISSDMFGKKEKSIQGKGSKTGEGETDNLFGTDITTRDTRDNQAESNEKVAKLYGASVPWKLSLRYTMGYSNSVRQNEISSNSLQFSGSVELSPKWNVGLSSGYDFKNKGITFTNLSFERDLDSWRMSFNWVPFGRYQTYYFFIGVKASVFQDLKYDQRKLLY